MRWKSITKYTRVATLPGHQKSRPCLGLRGVGQGGHPFLKSIIKIRRNRRSFHFTPATLAMPATFTSMGQRKISRRNQMPLPNLNRQCTVLARSTGNQCLNPAAFGCTSCRYHGAKRRETIRAGEHHPQFKHGERTQEAIERFRSKMLELQNIEALARSAETASIGKAGSFICALIRAKERY